MSSLRIEEEISEGEVRVVAANIGVELVDPAGNMDASPGGAIVQLPVDEAEYCCCSSCRCCRCWSY